MKITVLLFAQLAERVGTDQLAVTLSEGAIVGDAVEQVLRTHRNLSDFADTLATAVNLEYVERHYPLFDGDELALIPPVSGG